ncbi:acyl-CoA carboxylase epsilon subunit [Microbacterium telephonicum]
MSMADPDGVVRVDLVRGHADDDELAAVVAVATAAYLQETRAAVAEEQPRRSAWQITATAPRAPLRRDLGWSAHSL